MTITLYKNSRESNYVNKNKYLQIIDTLNGTLRENVSILNPSITIEYTADMLKANYAFIPTFNRYYFIVDIDIISNKLCVIHLNVDVLTTYQDMLNNQTAYIDRNQYSYDEKIVDSERIIQCGVDIEKVEIPNDVFNVGKKGYFQIIYALNGYQIYGNYRGI